MPEHKDTLTVEEIVGAHKALMHLDGYQKEVKDSAITVPYKFDDSTRWNIAKNKRILKTEAEAYEETRTALIKELSPDLGDVTKETNEKQEVFRLRHRELFARKIEVSGILKLKKSALLKDDSNPIPGTVLEYLIPILDETA